MKRTRDEPPNGSGMESAPKYRMVAPKGSEMMQDNGSPGSSQSITQTPEAKPVDQSFGQGHPKMPYGGSLSQPFQQHVPFRMMPSHSSGSQFSSQVPQLMQPPLMQQQMGQGQMHGQDQGLAADGRPNQLPLVGHTAGIQQQQQPQQTIQQVQQPPVSPQAAVGAGQAVPGGGQVKFETALEFLDKVKMQFHNQPQVYKQFLKIMKDFKSQEIDTPGVIQRVSTLFKGHNHLIMGFNHFLPEGYKIDAADLQALNAADHAADVANQQQVMAAEQDGSRKQPELDHARNYVKKIKVRFESQPEIYKAFLRILHTYHEEQHTIKDVYDQVASLFRNHTDLLAEFKDFLPDNSGSASQSRRGRGKSNKMRASKRKARSTEQAQTQVDVSDYNFFVKVKNQLRNDHLYGEFLKCLSLYNNGILADVEMMVLVRDLLDEYPEAYEEFKTYCDFDLERGSYQDVVEPSRMVEGFQGKNEIDFASCKRMGPSYRALPDDYIQPTCSGRTDDCQSVLNDIWVSMPTGSEDGGTFKTSRKNQYEEVLFKCEDDRYELDMVLENNAAVVRVLTAILHQIVNTPRTELANFELPGDALGALHVKSIQRIYGDKGQDIIQGLFQNPVVAVPCVLRRLRQKDLEWRDARREWNKVWREVNEKNYYKSLDHQSLYFKQKDKKALSSRELVAEAKKAKFAARTAEGGPLPGPHLSYDMSDSDLLTVVTDLVLTQARKSLSVSDYDKIDTFMTDFVVSALTTPESTGEEREAEKLETSAEKRKLFFTNTAFFVFFRLVQVLYHRVGSIKGMAAQAVEEKQAADKSVFSSRKPRKARFSSEEEVLEHFLENLLKPIMSGELDQALYEDECRELFGINAYVVFTMEKLLHHIVKQLHMILADDLCSSLVALQAYEASRSNGCVEEVYRAHSARLLEDERCFKLVFTTKGQTARMDVWLEDKQGEEELLAPRKERYQQYVDGYLQTSAPDDEAAPKGVFLPRNCKAVASRPNVLQNVEVANHLQCKMCLRTFRIFYVEDTEDTFYRPGGLSQAMAVSPAPRAARWQAWAARRLAQLPA